MTASWLPVALSVDLPAGTAMPVATMSGALALWRSEAGRLSAFADRCPHRGMRLSHGFVRGEALSCIYHGWRYGASGACLKIPAHPGLTPPPAIRAEACAVEEADGLIWVADGAPEGHALRLTGLVPLRSMTAHAPLRAVAAQGSPTEVAGLYRIDGRGPRFAVLLAEQPEVRTLIHVLVAEGAAPAERIAISRAAEALRRSVETTRHPEPA